MQTEEAVFTTKAEANIQYIKSELEALSDGGSLQEIALDPIQVKCRFFAFDFEKCLC